MQTKAVFDQADVEYLASHLNESQLRNEIHRAQIACVVAEQFRGTQFEDPSDHFPYRDYQIACEKALQLAKRKPKRRPIAGKVDIESLKASHDIVALVENYTKLRKVGNRFVGRCPIHNDTNPSLVVYPAQQSWYCFGACNRGGDVFDFIMAMEQVDFRQAIGVLSGT